MHLPGPDLDLKGDALGADDRGVQGLVHIGLGGGDIVLEAAGHQVEQVVDVAQDVVAVGDGIHDDPEGIDVIQLLHGLALGLHLAVDGVDVLDAAVGGGVDAHGGEPLGDLILDGAHEALVLLLVALQVRGDFLVFLGGEVAQGQILQLPLDPLHAKPVSQGGVDVHGLPALADLLFRGLVLHGAHIVQPVGDFDEDHPDVLAHGHEHLAQVFHLGLLGGGEVGPGQLGDPLHKLRYGGPEELFDLLVGGVGVLDAVVEQSA